MSDSTGLPQGDPLNGAAVAGRWSFGYDMPDDLGGSSYRAGQVTWKYGPWDEASWWTGETDPQRAVALLKSRGYDLLKHDPVPIDRSIYGPIPGSPSAGQPL